MFLGLAAPFAPPPFPFSTVESQSHTTTRHPEGRNLPKILMKSYEGGRVVLGARCSLRPSSSPLLNSRISVTYYDAATWGKELAEELDEQL